MVDGRLVFEWPVDSDIPIRGRSSVIYYLILSGKM